MRTVAEMRDTAEDTAKDVAGMARKAAYAAVGAPVVIGRRVVEYGGKLRQGARKEFDLLAAEGEKVTGDLRERKMVTEFREKVDLEHLQDRVEKLRDQLEDTLASWRESFRPDGPEEPKPAAEKPPAKKPAAKATAAKKPTTKKATPPSE
jgi:hypothetical protein